MQTGQSDRKGITEEAGRQRSWWWSCEGTGEHQKLVVEMPFFSAKRDSFLKVTVQVSYVNALITGAIGLHQ